MAKSIASEEWRASPAGRRVLLAAHLVVCRHCRAYRRSLLRLGDAVRALYPPDTGVRARPRLLATLRRAIVNPDHPSKP